MSTTATTIVPTGTWTVDPAHSRAGFTVKHLGIATVHGAFTDAQGTLELGEDLSQAKAYGTVKVASVSTGQEQRDEHLRSPDFFDVEQYPEISFSSTRVDVVDDDTLAITGDLTLHGVTREITLEAEIEGTETDPQGNERVGLAVTGQLKRSDFGMKFNMALGSGNVAVSDKVKLVLDVSAVRQA